MRAITLILMTSVLAFVSAPTVQAQMYLEGDGFVFDNGEFYLVPNGGRYGPPPDLADNVSPPEEFYEEPLSEPRTRPFAKPGTGMGLDYFPPAPESDDKVETPITVPETKQVTVVEVTPELKTEPVEKVVVEVPATNTKLTVETQKVESVTRPVRIVGDNKITQLAPPSELFPLQEEKTGGEYGWVFLLVLFLLVSAWLWRKPLFAGYLRWSAPVEEPPLATNLPLTPAETQSLQEEIETAKVEAQHRSDQMVEETQAEQQVAEHMEAATVQPKQKRKPAVARKRPARKRMTLREENSQLRASLTKIREGVTELVSALLGKPEVPLLPPPDKMTKLPPS